MRSLKLTIAVLVAASTPLLLFPKHGIGWISGEEIVSGFLAWPALIASIVLMLLAAGDGAFRRLFGIATTTFGVAAVLPATLLSTIVIRSIGKRLYLAEQTRIESWYHYDDKLIPHIIDYLRQQPTSITYPYNDDRAHIAGLGAFLRQRVPDVTIRGDDIIDPWGDPVWIVSDRDGDMQLRFEDQFYGVWTPRGNKPVVALVATKKHVLPPFFNDFEQWQITGGQSLMTPNLVVAIARFNEDHRRRPPAGRMSRVAQST